LKTGGIDTTSCISYSSACGTIDYVMKEIVNTTLKSVVYIDSGTYNYTITALHDLPTDSYFNRIFNLIGYLSGPFVNYSDINTYPVILCNSSNGGNASFHLYANVNASFQYLKFIIGNNSYINRRLIVSLFYFILFFFYFFCSFIYNTYKL
jgi:hypothetical protein